MYRHLTGILLLLALVAACAPAPAQPAANGAADLAVISLSVGQPQVRLGVPVPLSVTIKNLGPADVNEPFSVLLTSTSEDASRIRPLELPVTSLPAGAEITVTFPDVQFPAAGTSQVEVVVDSANTARDPQRANNRKQIPVMVKAPDLVVTRVTVSPQKLKAEQPVTVTVTIKNEGSHEAPKGFWVKFSSPLFKDPKEQQVNTALAPGAELDVNFLFFMPPTNQHLVLFAALADSRDDVRYEEDETNNQNVKLAGVNLPDLVVEEISVDPSNPRAKTPCNVSVRICNVGDDDIPGPFTVHLERVQAPSGGQPELPANPEQMRAASHGGWDQTVSGLRMGETVTIVFNQVWFDQTGLARVGASVDWGHTVENEQIRNNNSASVEVMVRE